MILILVVLQNLELVQFAGVRVFMVDGNVQLLAAAQQNPNMSIEVPGHVKAHHRQCGEQRGFIDERGQIEGWRLLRDPNRVPQVIPGPEGEPGPPPP